MAALSVLTNPRGFFANRANDDLLYGFGVVLLVAVLGALSAVPIAQVTISAFPEGTGGAIAPIVYASTIIGAFVGGVVTWAVAALLTHALTAVVADVRGSVSQTLTVVGWSFLPQAFGAILGLAIAGYVVYVQGVTIPTGDPQQLQGAIQAFTTRPLLRLSSLLNLVFVAWSGFIAAFGVSEVHDADLREAGLAVGIPIGLYVVWQLIQLL